MPVCGPELIHRASLDRRPRGSLRRSSRNVAGMVAAIALSGCATLPTQTFAPGERPVVQGPPVRDNVTPMEGVLACFADWVASSDQPPLVIATGDIKDYTGKYSINEGNAITQGGALMVYSALGKLSGAVHMAERYDPSIAERELAYTDRRQLGDGNSHTLDNSDGSQTVPWLPYFGGTIQRSDYFIVGGITELNYNIASGGGEVGINQIGAKNRTYTQSVGIDLRIVDTKTLLVVKTVSLTKQFSGYEVGFNVFRFFGSDLFDINVGAKGQEPLQLGIRTALEEGVTRLVSAVTDVDYRSCMRTYVGYTPMATAESLRTVANPSAVAGGPASGVRQPMNSTAAIGGGGGNGQAQLAFEFGSTELGGPSSARLDQIAAVGDGGSIELVLLARDTEVLDPGKRDALTNQRIAVITAALANRGVPAGAIRINWRPDPADTTMHRDGPGFQESAKLQVSF